MKRFARGILASLALAFAASPASAAFHLFTINEIYSNADGTVQFIEMTALASGQQFFNDHFLRASSGSDSHSYSTTTDLPGDTGGRRVLFGTVGFAALGVVQPDYIIPNNFLFQGGGSINWAGADVWVYGALPTDGNLSLGRSGVTSPNSPTNFFGVTGHVVPATTPVPVPSFQGLWWKSPAGSESGWGANLTHQGNFVFVTWFTYGPDGQQMWLSALLERVGTTGASFSGTIIRDAGASLTTDPWPSSSHTTTPAGTANMTFTDANNATFAYSLDGTTQTKAITRQIFAAGAPECFFTGGLGNPPNYSDLWWRSPDNSESGWGVNLTHQGNFLFLTWFTYGADGKGLWLEALLTPSGTAGTTWTGTLNRDSGASFSTNPWPSASHVVTPVGSVTLTFSNASNASFMYTFNGVTQTKSITRQVFASPVSVCR
jgi:hypothetical protein